MTLIHIIYSLVIAGVATAGSQFGFWGLFAGLLLGYLILCALDSGLDALLCGPESREMARQLKRPWPSLFPACDIRDLCWYSTYFFFAYIGILMVLFAPRLKTLYSPLGGILAILVSAVLCLVGQEILWRWTVRKLGATDQVSSWLSKPVEILVCYSLLIAGLLWITIAVYLPAWAMAWFLE